MPSSKTYAFRAPDKLAARLEAEKKRRSEAAGCDVKMSSLIVKLLSERLAEA